MVPQENTLNLNKTKRHLRSKVDLLVFGDRPTKFSSGWGSSAHVLNILHSVPLKHHELF